MSVLDQTDEWASVRLSIAVLSVCFQADHKRAILLYIFDLLLIAARQCVHLLPLSSSSQHIWKMVSLHNKRKLFPLHTTSVSEGQRSSRLSWFAIGTGRGQCRSGLAKQLLWPSVRARSHGGIHLVLSFHAACELEFIFYFFPKRPLILEGMKFHIVHFRLLCIASIRRSLVNFVFLCVFLAVVKGQAFCCRISKWISQRISAYYHMADKPLPSILKLSWLKYRLHLLRASGTSLFSEIYKTATWNNLLTSFFSPKICDP